MKKSVVLSIILVGILTLNGCGKSESAEVDTNNTEITTVEDTLIESTTSEEVSETEETTVETTITEEVTETELETTEVEELETVEETEEQSLESVDSESTETKFSTNGFNITLTSDFQEDELEGTTAYYISQGAMVMSIKETFDMLSQIGLDETSTLYDYAECVFANNGQEFELYESQDGSYLCFNYVSTVEEQDFYYFAVLSKGSDAFWITNFACLNEQAEEYQPVFEGWADSITVD